MKKILPDNEPDRATFGSGVEIEESKVSDAMHEFNRTAYTNNSPLTDEGRDRLLNLLKQARSGESGPIAETDPNIPSTDQLMSLLKKISAASVFEPGDRLREIRVAISSFLIEQGFPDPFSIVFSDATYWRLLPDEWPDMSAEERAAKLIAGENTEIGWAFARRVSAPLSDPWFAAEIASNVFFIDTLSADGRENALIRLGFLYGQWSSRRHLANVSRGKNVVTNARDGGLARGRNLAPQSADVIQVMAELRDAGKSIRTAAKNAKQRGFGSSPEANRKLWARKMKSPDSSR